MTPFYQPHMIGIGFSYGLIVCAPLNTSKFYIYRLKNWVMAGESEVADAVLIIIFLLDIEEALDAREAIFVIGTIHTTCTNRMGIFPRRGDITNQEMERLNGCTK